MAAATALPVALLLAAAVTARPAALLRVLPVAPVVGVLLPAALLLVTVLPAVLRLAPRQVRMFLRVHLPVADCLRATFRPALLRVRLAVQEPAVVTVRLVAHLLAAVTARPAAHPVAAMVLPELVATARPAALLPVAVGSCRRFTALRTRATAVGAAHRWVADLAALPANGQRRTRSASVGRRSWATSQASVCRSPWRASSQGCPAV